MNASSLNFLNGQRTFPEISEIMEKLCCYDESYYHAPGAARPRMVPANKWVKHREGQTSIFPGGCGVYGLTLPRAGIMLLFQDYDRLSTYQNAVEGGYGKREYTTVETAINVLREADVDLDLCYFTNRFVGVRDADSAYGKNPAWRPRKRHLAYIQMCDEILRAQLDIIMPRLILMYGAHVPESLGLAPLWTTRSIVRSTVLGHTAIISALTHSSMRAGNVGRVHYGGLKGHAAELLLIREAVAQAFQ